MQTLSLNITQDSAYEFFEHYDTLSPLRKKIWQLTVWYVKKHVVALPSQSTIAKQSGCCRQAVSEAFKIFKSLGWLHLRSRGFKRSKVLGIPQHLIMMDLVNRQYFKRIEATYRATHSYSTYKVGTSKASESHFMRKKILQPSYLGQKIGLTPQCSLKLSVFPEAVQQEALRRYENFAKKNKHRPSDREQYFIGIASKVCNENGIKPYWSDYYYTIKQKSC